MKTPLDFPGAVPGTAALGASAICVRLAGLSARQRTACARRPRAVVAAGLGVEAAAAECSRLFREQRWNCTGIGGAVGMMGRRLPVGSREAAFFHALTAAAVAHAVTAACSRGALGGCGCDATKEGLASPHGGANGAVGGANMIVGGDYGTVGGAYQSDTAVGGAHRAWGGTHERMGGAYGMKGGVSGTAGRSKGGTAVVGRVNGAAAGRANGMGGGLWKDEAAWRWGGCSADLEHGVEFSREFVDAGEAAHEARALMNLHNHGAGREALRRASTLHCRCHGISGSCSARTCWALLPPLREVSLRLKAKFKTARAVEAVLATRHRRPVFLHLKRPDTTSTRDAKSWKPRKPTKEELVFLEKSPDFCEEDARAGVAGTTGRRCHRRPGAGGCEILCCGRGYNTVLLHQHHVDDDDDDVDDDDDDVDDDADDVDDDDDDDDDGLTRDGDDGYGGGGGRAVKRRCNCAFHWCCHVSCSACARHQQRWRRRRRTEVHTCK
uniref:Protein Wnt n=1 Tax=Petromyzon marinus TaxID=7757 RepID=A0AAJ7XAL7_PETMA|nr:protein Wnt-7b-like [Petromyzon marinus]